VESNMHLIHLVWLLVTLAIALSHAEEHTIVVGGWLPQDVEGITRTLAPVFQDYLTEAVGSSMDPPVKFVFKPVDMDEGSSSRRFISEQGLDILCNFFYSGAFVSFNFRGADTVPGSIACKAAEFSWIPLVTQRNIVGSSVSGSDALVVFSLLNNTAIRKVEDLKDKKLACGYLLSGTTYLHGYQLLLDHGLHIFRDMTQVRFYGADYESYYQAVLRGELDVGFATSSWLTKTHNDEIDQLRIHDRQSAPSYEGQVYPSAVSRLTPTYGVVVSDRLSWQIKRKILAALENLNASHPGMKLMKLAGWSSSVNYGVSMIAAENSGVAYQTAEGAKMCRDPYDRLDIWTSIKCPGGYYKVDYNMSTRQCELAGIPCPAGVICFCRPCLLKPQNTFRWETVLGLCAALYGVGLFYFIMGHLQDLGPGPASWRGAALAAVGKLSDDELSARADDDADGGGGGLRRLPPSVHQRRRSKD